MRCSQPQINIQEIRVVFQDVTVIFYGSIGRYAVIIIIIFVHLSANNSTNIVTNSGVRLPEKPSTPINNNSTPVIIILFCTTLCQLTMTIRHFDFTFFQFLTPGIFTTWGIKIIMRKFGFFPQHHGNRVNCRCNHNFVGPYVYPSFPACSFVLVGFKE